MENEILYLDTVKVSQNKVMVFGEALFALRYFAQFFKEKT